MKKHPVFLVIGIILALVAVATVFRSLLPPTQQPTPTLQPTSTSSPQAGGTTLWGKRVSIDGHQYNVAVIAENVRETIKENAAGGPSFKVKTGVFSLVSSENGAVIDQISLGEKTIKVYEENILVFIPKSGEVFYETPELISSDDNKQAIITWGFKDTFVPQLSYAYLLEKDGKMQQIIFINEKGEEVSKIQGYAFLVDHEKLEVGYSTNNSNCSVQDTYKISKNILTLIHRSEWCEGLSQSGGPKPRTEQNFNQ